MVVVNVVLEDLVGKKFGKLTVIKLLPKDGERRKWECICECGKKCVAIASNLKRGNKKSCGCTPKAPEDLTNQRFGRLVALEILPKDGLHRKWKCRCDCGNITVVYAGDLKSSSIVSCGCYQKELISKKRLKDLTGMRFGKLTVIEREESLYKGAMWKCICECGNFCVTRGSSLTSGITRSCGCLS